VYQKDIKFDEIPLQLKYIVKDIDKEKVKNFRWFQDKANNIFDILLHDYAVLYEDNAAIIIAAVIDFSIGIADSKERKLSRYFVPLIVRRDIEDKNYIGIIKGSGFTAYLYDAVDDINYIRFVDSLLSSNKNIDFNNGGRLEAFKLIDYDIYKSERFSNKSTNSLTFLKKDEIIKTFRRMMPGINPDLEMTMMLKQNGFLSIEDIRGYFQYIDKEKNIYTIAMIFEYIDNIVDMWQFTQEYLKGILGKFAYMDDIPLEYIKKSSEEYLSEIKKIAGIIADMHIILSKITTNSFLKKNPKESDVKELISGINNNYTQLLNYLRDGIYDKETKEMFEKISHQKDTIEKASKYIAKLYPYFGQYIRCHGDLHLEQILKTEESYIIIDFEGEPTKPIQERNKKVSPLKDIAGILRSFDYAVYSAYFNYKDAYNSSVSELKNIEKFLLLWEDIVEETFIYTYLKIVKLYAPDILPDEKRLDMIVLLFKLDKALFEGVYEINNRPEWIKIPLKGIIKCLEGLGNNQIM
jgi:trehalose synthase-fused probable maltokinase